MGLFMKREDRRAPLASHQAHPAEDHGRPAEHVEAELELFGLHSQTEGDQLRRHALSSKPEDYFSCDPRHFHHEVL